MDPLQGMTLIEIGATPDMHLKTAALMDSSTGRKGMRGYSWFSLYLWPAFRRIFLLDKKLEVWHRRPDPSPAAVRAKKPDHDVPASTVPQIVIDTQLEHWIRWTLESNIALAAALKRLRDSYELLLAGKPAKDADEILAEVEDALRTVEEKSM
jgi:hypothetical protein